MKTIILIMLFLSELNFGLSKLIPFLIQSLQNTQLIQVKLIYWLFLVFALSLKIVLFKYLPLITKPIITNFRIWPLAKVAFLIQVGLTLVTLSSMV